MGNSMYDLTANIKHAMLDELCSDECESSISSFRDEVLKACSSDEFHDCGNATEIYGSSGVYAPAVLVDYYFTNYYQRCLRNSRGEYCMLYLQSTNSQVECEECGLKMNWVLLSDEHFYTEQMAAEFRALTSSCGVSMLPVPTPTPIALSSSSDLASTTPAACADRRFSISPGETCDTFAAWNPSVEWYNCVRANNARYCSLLHESFLEVYVPDDEDSLYADTPGNAASVSTSACYEWDEVVEGESFYCYPRTDVVEVSYLTCPSLMSEAGITIVDFYA
ncbi:hypothetical protein BJX66DRAFT_343481 [Aspergillus keveii]|uniref:LysM domain-containing protein n=1 Tax=Aspergillus keveii TaxID=714993 RepID=A0ABR4FP49_9EURO